LFSQNHLDEEAKRKDAKPQGRKGRHGATDVGAALGTGASLGESKGISLRPCAFASLRSAVQHRLNSCADLILTIRGLDISVG
jgi:hypothetical protein